MVKAVDTSKKKIYFGDDGQVIEKPVAEQSKQNKQEPDKKNQNVIQTNTAHDLEAKWYQLNQQHNTCDFTDIKDSELSKLKSLCTECYISETQILQKGKSQVAENLWQYLISRVFLNTKKFHGSISHQMFFR